MHKTPAPDTVPRFTQLSLLQVPAAKIGERELVVEHFNMTDNTADRKRTEHKAREQAHAKYATKHTSDTHGPSSSSALLFAEAPRYLLTPRISHLGPSFPSTESLTQFCLSEIHALKGKLDDQPEEKET
ncbi:hypothetical protein D9756_011042 [Leucocoprinus leucothites]|uniref:Uncharacterized protein n=1 Tax=Leucocoprinus leucothites TaxID=201217 RepID=A0A8H5FQ85_9AGAR|nr:hypothetical protein D9756_011042 [Leucoagaricus leucothites]